MANKIYVGIFNDKFGGMTAQGSIIRDAWVFGIIPETETCEGWDYDRMQILYDKVSAAWAQYNLLPSLLPPELKERHAKIHAEAIERAKKLGWNPELDEND